MPREWPVYKELDEHMEQVRQQIAKEKKRSLWLFVTGSGDHPGDTLTIRVDVRDEDAPEQ
jgi:hypothetical protein